MITDTAALLLETLRLDPRADPTPLCAAWLDVETKGLARLVDFEGCALWLRRRLAQLDTREFADRRFRTWLEHRGREIAARNLLVDAQTDRVVRALGDAGVPFVLIKGSARRALADAIPFIDARATTNVDILVPAEHARHAWERLRAAGYELEGQRLKRRAVTPPGHFHLPTVWNLSGVDVELHTSTSYDVSPAEAWRRANAVVRRGSRAGREVAVQACPTELLWDALTHAFHQDASAFRLRSFLDAAVILATPTSVNWAEIGRRLESSEIHNRHDAVQWLGTAAQLAGASLPESISGRVRPLDLAFVLRWRLALLRRIGVPGRLAAKVLDGLPQPAIVADRLRMRSKPAWFARAVSRMSQ